MAFSEVDSVLNQLSHVDNDIEENGQFHRSAKEKAEALNRQFSSVFTPPETGDIPSLGESPYEDIAQLNITTAGIEKLLQNLDPSKVQGPDNIPPWMLKLAAPEIAPFFRNLFQSSLECGEVPNIWKSANVTPIFKKGSRAKAVNYRGVSLTCVSSKIMEHILHSFMMKHLESNNILTDFQHGFCAKRSTETQLFMTINDIAQELDKNYTVDAAILDFSKAFDKVPHQRLISKLNYYGIVGPISNWIKHFLVVRIQRVLVDGASSTEVPQGTVLGPLGFLIYINDLPNNLSSTARLFADDCLLHNTIKSDRDISVLQEDLHKLEDWQKTWMMEFNPDKCVTMNIKSRNPP